VVAKLVDFGLFWAPIYVENRGALSLFFSCLTSIAGRPHQVTW
jgi:hypothetical protein